MTLCVGCTLVAKSHGCAMRIKAPVKPMLVNIKLSSQRSKAWLVIILVLKRAYKY